MKIESPYIGTAKPFSFRMPREVVFGSGCSALAVEKAAGLGSKRPLFLTGKSMGKSTRLTSLMDNAADSGMKPGHWDNVKPEPPVELLWQAVDFILNGEYDCLIALGGGSSMDFAKMAAILAKHPQLNVSETVGTNKIPARGLPTIMIPTTAGSGSEVSSVAVFSFENDRMKKGVSSGHLVADVALVDPAVTLQLPPDITAAAGMDALIHGVESYLSLGTNDFAQDLALTSIKNISANLEICVNDGSNLEARERQAYGSMLAGMAFSMAGTAGVHAMAYPLGGQYHIPHGEANTVLLRWVMEYNLEGCEEKFIPVAEAMGVYKSGMSAVDAADSALNAMAELAAKTGVKTRLRDLGIPKEASAEMAEAAMKETRLISNNPRPLDVCAVKSIYDRAW